MVKQADSNWTGLGTHRFRVAPRIGECITVNDENGIGQAYRVKAIAHPLEPVDTAGDLILEHVGTDVDWRMTL